MKQWKTKPKILKHFGKGKYQFQSKTKRFGRMALKHVKYHV